ncbi:MAG: MarR family transcriptional regulator [Actinobacteria bacterium]|nr:MAG: MarR family transcriptional regulator [Actinomycetota bacterium]
MTEDPLVEARELAFLLVRAAERTKADFGHAISGFDVSLPVARALLTLDSPVPMRALADQLACDQSYITSLADYLEARGLVTREPGQDRRVKVLTLTPKGVALRAELSGTVARTSAVMMRLSPAQRDDLRSLLAALVSD